MKTTTARVWRTRRGRPQKSASVVELCEFSHRRVDFLCLGELTLNPRRVANATCRSVFWCYNVSIDTASCQVSIHVDTVASENGIVQRLFSLRAPPTALSPWYADAGGVRWWCGGVAADTAAVAAATALGLEPRMLRRGCVIDSNRLCCSCKHQLHSIPSPACNNAIADSRLHPNAQLTMDTCWYLSSRKMWLEFQLLSLSCSDAT